MAPRACDLVKTFYLLLATLLICSNVFAEDPNCLREIPVNVVLPDAAIVRKLRPEQFIANIKNEPAAIASVIPDNGPRRIVFLVETPGMIPRAYISSNDRSLRALCGETGGLALVEDTTPQAETYKLADQRLELVKKRLDEFL